MGATQSDLAHAAAEEGTAAAAPEPTAAEIASGESGVPAEDKKSDAAEESAGSSPDSSANPHSSSSPAEDKEHASAEGGAAGNENLVQEAEPEVEKEEEEEEKKPPITEDEVKNTKTAPFDIRFPSTNQTKHCYTRYIEYHKCVKERGDGAPECDKYARYYRSLCPSEWIQRWNDQRAEGVFPGPY